MTSGKRKAPARGQSRGALIAVAADLFARKPYDEIFISDIAREAGVANGLLSYHFKGKRGLYLAVLAEALEEINALLQPREGETTREQRLRGLVRRQIEYRRDHTHIMALFRGGGQDPEVDELFEHGRQVGAGYFFDVLGVCVEPTPTLRVAVRGLMGLLEEATLDWLAHDRDMEIGDLEEVVYSGAVAVLATVRTAHPEIGIAVDELTATA
ncbi:TetR/AcrR family transcriptional regulator [Streptomyces sp. NPDC055078]